MPFKSEAQRAKFAQMVKTGEITQGKFDEWNHSTPKHIPNRLQKPEKAAPKPKGRKK